MLGWLFGCHHKQFSFPITPKKGQKRNEASVPTGTYVCCLDCGREFAYDWQNMRVIRRLEKNYTLISNHDEVA